MVLHHVQHRMFNFSVVGSLEIILIGLLLGSMLDIRI